MSWEHVIRFGGSVTVVVVALLNVWLARRNMQASKRNLELCEKLQGRR